MIWKLRVHGFFVVHEYIGQKVIAQKPHTYTGYWWAMHFNVCTCSDASSIFIPQHPGTQLYVPNAAAKSNGSQTTDHDPPKYNTIDTFTHRIPIMWYLPPYPCTSSVQWQDNFLDIAPTMAPSTATFHPNCSYNDDTVTTTMQPTTTYQSLPFKPYYLPPSHFDQKAMVASMWQQTLAEIPDYNFMVMMTATTTMTMMPSCPSATQNPQMPITIPPPCINLVALTTSIHASHPLHNPSTCNNDDILMTPNTTTKMMDDDGYTTTTYTPFTSYPQT